MNDDWDIVLLIVTSGLIVWGITRMMEWSERRAEK